MTESYGDTTLGILIDYVPRSVLEEIALVLKKGSSREGVGPLRWDRGKKFYMDKADNHSRRYSRGESCDKDSGRHPLAHVIIRCMQLLARELEGEDGEKLETGKTI